MVENDDIDVRLKVCISTARAISAEATGAFDHNRLDKFTVEWVENQLALLEDWTREMPPIGRQVKDTLEFFSEFSREPETSQRLVYNRLWAWLWGSMNAIESGLKYLEEADP